MVEVKLCDSLCIDGFVTGEKYSHFGTSLVCDGQNGSVAVGLGKFDDEIKCDGRKR